MPESGVPAMSRARPPYPPEFRSEAVELVRSAQKSVVEVARDLGVSEQTLPNWLRQADLDAGRRHDGLTTAEREEVTRPRRENRVLRQERDILRTAASASQGRS